MNISRNEELLELMSTPGVSGMSPVEYVKAMIASIPMTPYALAKKIHAAVDCVYGWRDGRDMPTYARLEQLAEMSGMPIEKYFPEMAAGIYLMENYRFWMDGFEINRMINGGAGISYARYRRILVGDIDKTTMFLKTPLQLYRYYRDWLEEREAATEETPEDADARERETAEKAYRFLFGNTRNFKEFNLKQERKGLWTMHSRKLYRFEIDIDNREIRAIFLPSNKLSERWEMPQGGFTWNT